MELHLLKSDKRANGLSIGKKVPFIFHQTKRKPKHPRCFVILHIQYQKYLGYISYLFKTRVVFKLNPLFSISV